MDFADTMGKQHQNSEEMSFGLVETDQVQSNELQNAFKGQIPDLDSHVVKRSPRGFDPADEEEYEAQERKDLFNKLRLSIATHESSHTISPGPINKK